MATRAQAHPAATTWLMVAVAVAGISVSAPLSAATAAPVLAVALWRNAGGTLVSASWLALRNRSIRSSGRRPDHASGREADQASGAEADDVSSRGNARHAGRGTVEPRAARLPALAVLAGALLAVHFVSWLTGLRLTTVTASTALVCTTPIWTVALDVARGVRVPRAVLAGVLLATAGVLAITGVDAARSGRALLGDGLSLVGAVAGAGYVAAGERVLRTWSTPAYTTTAYGACAALLLPVCLLTGTPLTGFEPVTWVQLAAITLGAQLLGHTLLNAALPRIGVTAVATVILLEVPGATLVAWALTGQVPPLSVLPGTAAMLLGVLVVIRARPPARTSLPSPSRSPDERSGRASASAVTDGTGA